MSNVNRGFWWRDPAEVERLKASADLVGMIRAHGVVLKAEGADLVGLCPFHQEKTPSFRVTPSKNLWHCFGCNKGGSAVDWLVASRGVSLREAFEALRVATGVVEYNETRAPELVETVFRADPTWSDGRLLAAVTDYYAERLRQSPSSQEFLTRRGLWDAALVDRFRLGVSDRSLGPALEKHPAGAVLRQRLVSLGVFRENGREHLRGSLVVPILGKPDEQGICETLGMYGRKTGREYRADTPIHLYLKGVPNSAKAASGFGAKRPGPLAV